MVDFVHKELVVLMNTYICDIDYALHLEIIPREHGEIWVLTLLTLLSLEKTWNIQYAGKSTKQLYYHSMLSRIKYYMLKIMSFDYWFILNA